MTIKQLYLQAEPPLDSYGRDLHQLSFDRSSRPVTGKPPSPVECENDGWHTASPLPPDVISYDWIASNINNIDMSFLINRELECTEEHDFSSMATTPLSSRSSGVESTSLDSTPVDFTANPCQSLPESVCADVDLLNFTPEGTPESVPSNSSRTSNAFNAPRLHDISCAATSGLDNFNTATAWLFQHNMDGTTTTTAASSSANIAYFAPASYLEHAPIPNHDPRQLFPSPHLTQPPPGNPPLNEHSAFAPQPSAAFGFVATHNASETQHIPRLSQPLGYQSHYFTQSPILSHDNVIGQRPPQLSAIPPMSQREPIYNGESFPPIRSFQHAANTFSPVSRAMSSGGFVPGTSFSMISTPLPPLPKQAAPFVPQAYGSTPATSDVGSSSELRGRKTQEKRRGGRQPGSHLEPAVLESSKKMRKSNACWRCAMSRESCTEGEMCKRCATRSSRFSTEPVICDRTKLVTLRQYFIPGIISSIHEELELMKFMTDNVSRWSETPIKVRLACISGLPVTIEMDLHEFQPNGRELLRQFRERYNPETGKRDMIESKSAPLGLLRIGPLHKTAWTNYVCDIADNHFDKFAKSGFSDEKNDFQQRLLHILWCVDAGATGEDAKRASKIRKENDVLRQVKRLLVAAYIMDHTINIVDSEKESVLSKMDSYVPGAYPRGEAVSTRLANRQFKFILCAIYRDMMSAVLVSIDQYLHRSKAYQSWLTSFCALLGLATVHEDTQKTIHVIVKSHREGGFFASREADIAAVRLAEDYCKVIDERFGYIMGLFRRKFSGFNPLMDWHLDQVKEKAGEQTLLLAEHVHNLVKEKYDYLYNRQSVPMLAENTDLYSCRLVARLLLPFFHIN